MSQTADLNFLPTVRRPGSERALRVGLALCFIGHGSLAIARYAPWFAFYVPFGLDESFARLTMPLVGALDLVVALALVFRPSRALFAWCLAWTVFTAALRPLSGGGAEEVLVRAMNFGPPLVLLARTDRARLALVCAALALTGAGALMGARVVPAHVTNVLEWLERGGVVGLAIACVSLISRGSKPPPHR